MLAEWKPAGRPSLREERNRHRELRAGRRLETVIAGLRERPSDRLRRLDARKSPRPRSQGAP